MTTNHSFPFQKSAYITNCKVLWSPTGVGDSFSFETEDGVRFQVNPLSSEFIGAMVQEDVIEPEPEEPLPI